MANSVYLSRLAENMQDELPIPLADWNACVQAVEDTRLAGEDGGREVQVYNEDSQQWELLFWLPTDGRAYTHAGPFFEDAGGSSTRYCKAMELARCLRACLHGEENDFYYVPEWHDFFWTNSDEPESVDGEEVREYRKRHGRDVAHLHPRLAALRIDRMRAEQPLPSPPRAAAASKAKLFWQRYAWLLWLGLCVLYYLAMRLR